MTTPTAAPAGTRTLARLAEAALERTGDHESLLFEGRTWRSGELHERARRAGRGLTDLGVAPGDRVVVLMANCPEVFITYQAIWRAGAVVTPVVFLVTAAELRHILVDAEVSVVVTTPEFLPKVAEAAENVPSVRAVVVAGPGPAAGPPGLPVRSFADLESAEPAELVTRSEDDLAALMYTGGTTGRAKGVMLRHRNLWSCGASSFAASHQPGITRTILPLPLSHAYGMIVTVSGMHSEEPGFTVLMRWFDPAAWVALVAEHRIQRAAVVPAMLQLLLGQDLEAADLSSLAIVGSGAAPLAREVIAEFERRVPGVVVSEGYGCTESGGVISTNPPGQRRIGTVGRPIPGYQVRILDDADQALPLGSDGEVAVRAEGVMQGYWRSPEATAVALRDGWLHTGDIGHLDAEGYLHIVDRKKDLIIRNGYNVYPRDVEDALAEHPAVAMAGCVGRPDARVGEEVVAFVSLRAGAQADADELVAFAKTRLAGSKYPREIRILPEIPLTSVGKLDRKALRTKI